MEKPVYEIGDVIIRKPGTGAEGAVGIITGVKIRDEVGNPVSYFVKTSKDPKTWWTPENFYLASKLHKALF